MPEKQIEFQNGNMEKILLSIIIPIYNVELYLGACLDSVRTAVEDIPSEVLLIDDGSTDDSSLIAEEYAQRHRKFFYFRESNAGLSAARNKGAAMARGEYIAFVDSDDTVSSDMYQKLLHTAVMHQSEMAVIDVSRLQGNVVQASLLHTYAFYKLRKTVTHLKEWPAFVYDTTSWNKLIKRSFYERNEFMYPEGYFFEDNPVSFRMHYLADHVSVIKSFGYNWRRRLDNSSITQTRKELRKLTDKIEMLRATLAYTEDLCKEKYIRKALIGKIMQLDFDSFIEVLGELPGQDSILFLNNMMAFTKEIYDPEVFEKQSLYTRQKITYLMDGDLKGLIRLNNYRNINYSNAPVSLTSQGYMMKLPDNIFTIPYRDAENNYRQLPAITHIDKVEVDKSKIRISAHHYYRRISMPDFSFQQIRVFIQNEYSGKEIFFDTEPILCPHLTKVRGRIINHDDYETYNYNYDGTGFVFSFDLADIVVDQEMLGNNIFMIEFSNSLDQGMRILRGCTAKDKAILEAVKLEYGDYEEKLVVDERQTLMLCIS